MLQPERTEVVSISAERYKDLLWFEVERNQAVQIATDYCTKEMIRFLGLGPQDHLILDMLRAALRMADEYRKFLAGISE